MRLCITSHVAFYRRGGCYYCTPGFACNLEMFAPLFGRIDLCVPVFEGEPQRGAGKVDIPNLVVRELPPYFRRWEIAALAQPLRLMRCLWPWIRRCDAAWIFLPNYLGHLAWITCLLQGKRFALRVVGNSPELMRLGFSRLGHPIFGRLVGGGHGLAMHAMVRTSAVAFVHGRELANTFGRGNRHVVRVVGSTIEASDIVDDIATSPGKGRRILYVGEFNFAKGLAELFAALKRLRDDGLNVRLDLAGGGWRQADFERMAADVGVADAVTFLGWVPPDRLVEEYKSSDVLAMPSYSEGGPQVVLQAMARGLAVVATRVGSVPVLIEDGESGFIVPPKNADALCGALRRILTDEGLRQRMARSALSRARLFTLEKERATVAAGFRTFGLLRNCSQAEGDGGERSRSA